VSPKPAQKWKETFGLNELKQINFDLKTINDPPTAAEFTNGEIRLDHLPCSAWKKNTRVR